jgi:hypothetical protein
LGKFGVIVRITAHVTKGYIGDDIGSVVMAARWLWGVFLTNRQYLHICKSAEQFTPSMALRLPVSRGEIATRSPAGFTLIAVIYMSLCIQVPCRIADSRRWTRLRPWFGGIERA